MTQETFKPTVTIKPESNGNGNVKISNGKIIISGTLITSTILGALYLILRFAPISQARPSTEIIEINKRLAVCETEDKVNRIRYEYIKEALDEIKADIKKLTTSTGE